MNISTFIAKRYFFTSKKKNFVHLITFISITLIAICVASLIIVLSVFNGLESLLRSLNSSFDPHLKIELVKGKSFEMNPELATQLQNVEGVTNVMEVIEDYAYIKYKNAELVVTMKGIQDGFIEDGRIQSSIIYGDLKFEEKGLDYAILGNGVYMMLGINPNDEISALQFYYIKDAPTRGLSSTNLYSRKGIMPGAVFSIQKYYDENYVFVPLDFAADLMNYGNRRTSLEVMVHQDFNVKSVQDEIQSVLGTDFKVLNQDEQHADLYKILKVEKLVAFIAISLITAIGSINILFVLTMLAIEKKADISILFSMGLKANQVRNIFLKKGVFIASSGTIVGLLLGYTVCWVQQTYGIVSMGMESAVQNEYPVELNPVDFVATGVCVIVIALLVSLRPARIAMKNVGLKDLPS